MCTDFRMLNKETKINAYLIPHTNEILDCPCKARVFLKIDLSKAYHQIAIELSHMHKTAFLMKYRLLEFLILLFRLVNAPEIF